MFSNVILILKQLVVATYLPEVAIDLLPVLEADRPDRDSLVRLLPKMMARFGIYFRLTLRAPPPCKLLLRIIYV